MLEAGDGSGGGNEECCGEEAIDGWENIYEFEANDGRKWGMSRMILKLIIE